MAYQVIQGFNSTMAGMLGLDAKKVVSLSINLNADSTEVDAKLVLDGVVADVVLTYTLSDE